MKLFYHLLSPVLLGSVCLGLVGCHTPRKTTHLSNGYEEVVTHARTYLAADDPPPARIAFQYLGPDGKLTRIWPSLYGVNEVIHGNLAIFVGDQIRMDTGSPTSHPRLFAVNAPALPLDITEEVITLWSKTTGQDYAKAMQRFNVASPEATSDGMLLHLEFLMNDYLVVDKNWPDKSDLKLSWEQVTNIMTTVKIKGTEKRDLGWHTPYIGE